MSVPQAMRLSALKSALTPWAVTDASVMKAISGKRMGGHAPKETKVYTSMHYYPGPNIAKENCSTVERGCEKVIQPMPNLGHWSNRTESGPLT